VAVGKALSMAGSAMAGTFRVTREAVNAFGGLQSLLAGAGIVGGFKKIVGAAIALGEQTDRARVLFGKDSQYIIDQANLMGEAFGVNRGTFIGAASEIGGMLQGQGFAAADAAKMGATFAKMAKDVGSATQMGDEEAMQRMMSGLSGEAEAVRRWGVDLSEANLKLKMLSMGMKAQGGEFSQSQKVQARMAIMTEKLAYAQGNLAKTADGAENATKGLVGRFQNLMETVGTAMLPIVGSAMVELQVGVEALSMTWQSMTAGIVNDQVGVVGAVGETASSMGLLQKAVGFVADSFQVLKIGFYAVQSFITSGISAIVQGFSGLGSALDYIVEKLTGAKLGIGDFMDAYAEDLGRLSATQYAAFQTELARPAASESVNASFAAAQERIKAMRTEATKPGVDVTQFKPTEGLAAPKSTDTKFASAARVGSSEATNAILRSRYGGGAGGRQPEEQTAKNTARTVQLLERIAGATMAGGANLATAQMLGGGVLASNF
jgi:hypothetical protein